MNMETPKQEKFWFLVSGAMLLAVALITIAKLTETDKFAPIQQQLDKEHQQMNIRVLSEHV